MNLQKILEVLKELFKDKEVIEFSNHKALCNALGIEPKEGKSRSLQQEQLKRIVTITKGKGNRLILSNLKNEVPPEVTKKSQDKLKQYSKNFRRLIENEAYTAYTTSNGTIYKSIAQLQEQYFNITKEKCEEIKDKIVNKYKKELDAPLIRYYCFIVQDIIDKKIISKGWKANINALNKQGYNNREALRFVTRIGDVEQFYNFEDETLCNLWSIHCDNFAVSEGIKPYKNWTTTMKQASSQQWYECLKSFKKKYKQLLETTLDVKGKTISNANAIIRIQKVVAISHNNPLEIRKLTHREKVDITLECLKEVKETVRFSVEARKNKLKEEGIKAPIGKVSEGRMKKYEEKLKEFNRINELEENIKLNYMYLLLDETIDKA